MQVTDIMPPIPTMDYSKFMDKMMVSYEKYPKNSLSQREVVHSLELGNMSFEEAQKIADSLNDEVSNTILSFQEKFNKKRSK
jgi:hypothetical protein